MKKLQDCDTECYSNFWLIKFMDRATKKYSSFRMTPGQPLDIAGVRAELDASTIITFNGLNYDEPMITFALAGADNATLKRISDQIIVGGVKPWQLLEQHNLRKLWLDQIDLIEVAPGMASLKIYGGRVHAKRMQDLPIDPAAILTPAEMEAIDTYCGNDLLTTDDLFAAVQPDIDLRIELGLQYGIDLRSKSDAQIAEAAFKKLLNLSYQQCEAIKSRAYKMPGTQFYYVAPPFIKFTTPLMRDTLAMVQQQPFTIGKGGAPMASEAMTEARVTIGPSTYQLGSGGLHSTEESKSHIADATFSLVDVDVVSYYPKIISILRMYPPEIGPSFLTIYEEWIARRIAYKVAGDKKKAGTFKIKINGTFGKTGSMFSILYAPEMMIQTTVTGQLALLMLIERLHVAGIDVVSANTDGVVIKCRRDLHPIRDAIVKLWELDTGFETEANEYQALFSRDINNYMAFKPAKGGKPIEVKTKGAYADDPASRLAKNPTNAICVEAVKAYIIDGTPLEQTIRQCSDIRKFITVRAVKGGGCWVANTIEGVTVGAKRAALDAAGWMEPRKGEWFEPCGSAVALSTDAAIKVLRDAIPRTYLGKAVRWYYGQGQTGHIAYSSNGNLVARSEGAKPCMELPDVMPPDVNYQFYIDEAKSILKDINCC